LLTLLLLLKLSCCLEIISRVDKEGVSHIASFLLLPLAYVVRDLVDLPDPDPGFGQPDYVQEMVQRGAHTTIHFQNDNKEVWNVICHMTHGGLAWNWVSQYARTCNGSKA
jgi:hypothetical protein